MSVFLDTNILIYSISSDSTESAKREKADDIVRRDDCVISVQVLQEFYAQMTRANRPGVLSHETVLSPDRGMAEISDPGEYLCGPCKGS